MMMVDGRGYAAGGVAGSLGIDAGSLGIDAGISLAACLLLGVVLTRLPGKAFSAGPAQIELISALPQKE